MKRLLALFMLIFAAESNAATPVLDLANCEFVATDTPTTDLTFNIPTGADTGELLIAITINDDNDPNLRWNTTPSGWAQQFQGGDSTTDLKWAVWTRVVNGSEADPTTFTSDEANDVLGWMCTVSGQHASAFWDVEGTEQSGISTSSTVVIDEVTTTVDEALAFYLIAFDGSDGGPMSVSGTGWTEADDQEIGTAPEGIAASFGTKEISTAGLTGDATVTLGTDDGFLAIQFAIAPAASAAPTFTSNPALDSCTDTGCTFDYTADAASDTLYAMFTDTAASAPTCDAIEATTGSHGAANESTTGSADSITITSTDTPEFSTYDAHFCIEDSGGNDSSVVTVSDVLLANPTGFQHVAITSIGTGSPCEDFNTATDPDIANGDYLLAPTTVSPGAYALTIGADCQFSYPGGDPEQQSALDISVLDVSAGDWHADDIDFYANNNAPAWANPVDDPLILDQNVAMTTIDLTQNCTDEDGDALTFSLTSGTLPTGVTLSGTGNKDYGGTPSVEDETGVAIEFTCTDAPGDTATDTHTAYVINTWTMPDCTGDTVAACETAVDAVAAWYGGVSISTSSACSVSVASGDIISQIPSDGEVDDPLQAISAVVSLGETTPNCEPPKRKQLQLSLGLW